MRQTANTKHGHTVVHQSLVIGFVVCVFAMPILVAVMIRQREMTQNTMKNEFRSVREDHSFRSDEDDDHHHRFSALSMARELQPPPAVLSESGETEGSDFWQANDQLLEDAWAEWADSVMLPELLEHDIIDPSLEQAAANMLRSPSQTNEQAVKNLLTEVIPGVYSLQLFNPDAVTKLRRHIDAAINSGIPQRRPNGMNRFGLIIDKDTEGGVTYPMLDSFRDLVAQRYMRPLGRICFNDYIGTNDDKETYAFTISYRPGDDEELSEHSDASLVSMNVNLNLPHEDYEGSSIVFADEDGTTKHELVFQPGMALLHRGLHKHAALPLQRGQRHNMVFWLFGKNGYVRIAKYDDDERLDMYQRWSMAQPDTAVQVPVETGKDDTDSEDEHRAAHTVTE